MRIWLLKDGEQLPLHADAKQMRIGMLAEHLQARGHEVHWFASTFDHYQKTLRTSEDTQMTLANGVALYLLHAGSYLRNLTVARVRHHALLACRWRHMAEQQPKPDVIVVAYPIIEWAREAVRFGKAHGIPVIVDVRDLWPDTFCKLVSPLLRLPVMLASKLLYADVGQLLRRADALTAMSRDVLNWAVRKAGRAPNAQTRVFYLGTDLPAPKGLIRPAREVLQICFVGSLGNNSDALIIAEAARLLQGEALHITIAGDGDFMPALRERVAGLANVTLRGWLARDGVDAVLRESDIALLTGDCEAMPNKFFDYVAYGLPIICSMRGEVRDYVEAHGLGPVCDANNPEALAEAIRQAIHGLKTYRAAAAQVPPAHYAKHAIYAEFADFIEQQVAR